MQSKKISDGLEFRRIGVFQPKLTVTIVQELNRRKIAYQLNEIDEHSTELSVLKDSSAEASELLNEIKRKHKRIRL